jgi:hypothetical protein
VGVGVSVGPGVDDGVRIGGGVASAGVAVCGGSVGMVIEFVTVSVVLGVGGFTPELGVDVGSGDSGL